MHIMEKQDIYEHLAEIYLDASLTKKKKPRGWTIKGIAGWAAAGAVVIRVCFFYFFGPAQKTAGFRKCSVAFQQ